MLILRLARIAALLGVIAIVALSLVPGVLRPSTGFGKTIEHATAYCLVAGMLTITSRARWPQLMALALIALAAFLEIGQTWIPGRDPMLTDFFASSAGALLGAGLATFVLARISRPCSV